MGGATDARLSGALTGHLLTTTGRRGRTGHARAGPVSRSDQPAGIVTLIFSVQVRCTLSSLEQFMTPVFFLPLIPL